MNSDIGITIKKPFPLYLFFLMLLFVFFSSNWLSGAAFLFVFLNVAFSCLFLMFLFLVFSS